MKQKLDVGKIRNEVELYLQDDTFLNYSEDASCSTIHLYFNEENIYDSYSKNSLLNKDIYDSIKETFSYIDKKKEIQFEFHFEKNIEEKEKQKIKRAFKAHYAQEVLKGKKQSFRIKIISLILLLVGALFLITDGILLALGNHFIFQNIIEIVAWVFIWEAANAFFFENASNKKEWLENIRIFEANILMK